MNKEAVSTCSLLDVSVAVHKQVVCAKTKQKKKRNCLIKIDNRKKWKI